MRLLPLSSETHTEFIVQGYVLSLSVLCSLGPGEGTGDTKPHVRPPACSREVCRHVAS